MSEHEAGSAQYDPVMSRSGAGWWGRAGAALRVLAAAHPGLAVAGLGLLGGMAITFPLFLHLDSDIFGRPGDPTGTIADYWVWGYALTHGRSLFDFPWGAPLGSGFELVPLTALQVVVSAPLSALLGPTVTYNLEFLSGFPLTAGVTFLLARRLGLEALPALFAALAFTFMPYHIEKEMGHLAIAQAEVFSGTLLFLVAWRQSGRWWHLAGAGVVAGLALCIDPYDAYIIAVMTLAFFVVSALLRSDNRPKLWSRLGRHVAGGAVVAITAGAFVPPALFFLHRPGTAGGYLGGLTAGAQAATRSAADVVAFSARLREYVLPWHSNPLTPPSVVAYETANLHGSNFTESSLFLGYTVILLAVVGLVLSRRLFPVALAIGVGLAGMVFAEAPTAHHLPFGIQVEAPSYYLFPLLPYFRVYARFAILVMLAAALLAGLGMAVLSARLGTGRRRLLLVVPFLLLALEFNNVPPTHTTRLYPPPAAYTWLASQPPGILVEYPLAAGNPGLEEIQTRQYTLFQQFHAHPLFNGATALSRAGQLAPQMEPYSSPRAVGLLQSLGIRYVFVHRADYAADGLQTPHAVPGLRFLADMDGIDVFEVERDASGTAAVGAR